MHTEPILSFPLFGHQFNIYLYGLFIGLGIVACIILLFVYTSKMGMPEKVQDYAFFVGIVAIAFGFLAAKFYQAVYNWIGSGFTKFDFYSAGITAMGGFIGGAGAFLLVYFLVGKYYFKGKSLGLHKKHFNTILLVAPICVTIAHAFGRIGCLFAGCCHGKFISYQSGNGGLLMEGSKGLGYYIPVQLYEALFLFALTAILSLLYFKRCNVTHVIYLVSYGVWRIIIEFFRSDTRVVVSNGVKSIFDILSPSQWQSIFFILGGLALLIVYKAKKIPLFLPKEKD